MSNYRESSWQRDINRFGALAEHFSRATGLGLRQRIAARMADIQARWPQHIKDCEVPNV